MGLKALKLNETIFSKVWTKTKAVHVSVKNLKHKLSKKLSFKDKKIAST